jgi:hypothetical protein
MPAIEERCGFTSPVADPEADALLAQVYVLPEAEALRLYARLSPRMQWLARQRTCGPRRSALIVHHALTQAHSR